MAELYRHTDEDGDTVVLQTEAEGRYTVNVFNLGAPDLRTCVYLDSAALLDLSDALADHHEQIEAEYCCADAAACRGEDEILHTGGCRNRCGHPVPYESPLQPATYRCALTTRHDGDHWLHPTYRPGGTDG